jgi:hypothetical protein
MQDETTISFKVNEKTIVGKKQNKIVIICPENFHLKYINWLKTYFLTFVFKKFDYVAYWDVRFQLQTFLTALTTT